VIYDTLIQAFGSVGLLFAFSIMFFIALFIVTRQSLASSLLLGMVALDGLIRIGSDQFISTLYLALKIMVFAYIGFSIARGVMKT